MTSEVVGFRRLYAALGCSLSGGNELFFSVPLGSGTHVDVYIGPRPRFGISKYDFPRYMVPGVRFNMEMRYHAELSESGHPGSFFTEVYAWTLVEVEDEDSLIFRSGVPLAKSPADLLSREMRRTLEDACDLVAGTLGLRFHRQLVIELLDQGVVVALDTRRGAPVMTSPTMEMLEAIQFNEAAPTIFRETFRGLFGGLSDDDPPKVAIWAMSWLLRAWPEADPVVRFLTLFVPFEIVLQGVGAEVEAPDRRIEEVERAILEHGGDKSSDLVRYVRHLGTLTKPGLGVRFRSLAEATKSPGWEEDVAAFTRFNKIRNGLLHRGDPSIQLTVPVGESEIRQLQDLVERYVCIRIFGDSRVYESRWRWTTLPPEVKAAMAQQQPAPSSKPTSLPPSTLRSYTEKLAYALWERGGRRHGHDADDWRQAEAMIGRRLGRDTKPA